MYDQRATVEFGLFGVRTIRLLTVPPPYVSPQTIRPRYCQPLGDDSSPIVSYPVLQYTT